MGRSAHRVMIAAGVLALLFGGSAIGISAWTRMQLLASSDPGTCVYPHHLARFESGKWSTRGLLTRVALHRGFPGRHWRASTWLLHHVAVSYLGFLFVSAEERIVLVKGVPACPPPAAHP